MRSEDKQPLLSEHSIPAMLDTSFESIIDKFEVTVFTLAMDLTGDDSLASEVVEEVFIGLRKELLADSELDVERAVHRLTYGVALKKKFSTPTDSEGLDQPKYKA